MREKKCSGYFIQALRQQNIMEPQAHWELYTVPRVTRLDKRSTGIRGDRLKAASVVRHKAQNAVNATIGSTIRYSLAASALLNPRKSKAMLNAALPETRVVRNAVTQQLCKQHTRWEMGGLGFKDTRHSTYRTHQSSTGSWTYGNRSRQVI